MAIDQSSYTFTSLTLPGIAVVPQLADIDNRGDIVGHYDEPGGEHGFLLRGGAITILDVPGAQGTTADGVNDAGDVVGTYLSSDFVLHGFLWHDGVFTTLDIPGARDTELNGINDRGQIIAFASAGEPGAPAGGFLYDKGAFAPITVPGHPDAFLVPEGINNRSDITGESGNQGFVLAADGTFTLISNPFSSFDVRPADINDQDQVVGSLSPAARTDVGFVYEDGVVTIFGPPEPAGPPPDWGLRGINDAGDIIGNSIAGGPPLAFAFLATPHPVPPPPSGGVDWNALAAQVEANFAATGEWFVSGQTPPPPTTPGGQVDWDALATQVEANFAATGQWFA